MEPPRSPRPHILLTEKKNISTRKHWQPREKERQESSVFLLSYEIHSSNWENMNAGQLLHSPGCGGCPSVASWFSEGPSALEASLHPRECPPTPGVLGSGGSAPCCLPEGPVPMHSGDQQGAERLTGFGGQGECYKARIWPYTRLSCNFKTALGDRSHKLYNSPSSVGSGDF